MIAWLISDVPGDVAVGVAGAGAAAIGALWFHVRLLHSQNRADLREVMSAIHELARSQWEMARALDIHTQAVHHDSRDAR